MQIDTSNFALVSKPAKAAGVAILNPSAVLGKLLTDDEALVLAAWLVAMTDPGGERFTQVLHQVLNT